MTKWKKTTFPGVRYREHGSRRHGVKKDQYFTIRYKLNGRDKEEGLGWASEDWTASKAHGVLSELKHNRESGGQGPQTLKEKREIEEARREQVEQARIEAEKENITFGAFVVDTYLPQCELDKKPGTHKAEENIYRNHLAILAGLPFNKIAPFHLERVKKTMFDKGLSNRTVRAALELTRHIFNVAQNRGIWAGRSPTKGVTFPKLDNMKMRYLSIDETETLLAALTAKSQNLHDIALLSLHTGLRFGEIAALQWSCVNWEGGTLAILNGKTGSRTAYLTERAKAMLKSRKPGRPDELIFPKKSKRLRPNDLSAEQMEQVSKSFFDTVQELRFNEGITDRKQKITFHSLRHSYATHLYEQTHDLYLTQRSLGHTTSTMTARYAKMSESRLREGVAALEKAFSAHGKKDTRQVIKFKK